MKYLLYHNLIQDYCYIHLPTYKTQNKLSVNYKTFCTDFTSINIKQNVNLEYKNKYFYICN